MNRRISLTLLLTLLLLTLSACAAPATPTAVPPATAAPTTAPVAAPTDLPAPTGPTDAPSAAPTAASLTLTDGLTRTVTLAGPAQRIVSLAPSNTEMLFAIGAGDQVVGRDMFSDYPAEAAAITDIGGGFGDIALETVVSLTPDLMLAAESTTVDQIKALEDLGLTVYWLPNPTNLDEMYANLLTVGQLSGHEAEAEAAVAELKARVAAVADALAGVTERPVVFYELDGTDPAAPWTAGPGTFIDRMITLAGGENLGAQLPSDWAQLSLETLLTTEPDIIILGDATWGGVTPEAVAARAGWDSLTAVKEGRVIPFDDNLFGRPGPRLVDGLEVMARLLHPTLFP